LKAIAELPKVQRRIAVFLGDRAFKTSDGIEALPVARFLEELDAGTVY
jgi:hypothetical protein